MAVAGLIPVKMAVTEIFKYLLLIFIIIGVLNIGTFAILWRKTGSPYFKILLQAWSAGVLSLLVQPLIAGKGPLNHALGFLFIFPYAWYLSQLLARLADISFPKKLFLSCLGVLLMTSFGLYSLGASDMAIIFPVTLACSIPPFWTSLKVMFTRWRSVSIIGKGYTIFLFLEAVHDLDYAFVHSDMLLIALGFSFGLVLTVGFTMFGLAVVMEQVSAENSALEFDLRYRAQMNHSAKLAAIGEMAGGIAHEINNPLQIILGQSDMIARSLNRPELDRDYMKDRLGRLKANVDRIATIVSGLISFSKDGRQDPIQEEYLGSIIDRSLDLYGCKMKDDGIELFREAIDRSLVVLCRPVEISQVLVNILNNARDAVTGADQKWIRICVEEEESSIRLAVTDSGPGIPESLREKIFQPFFTTKEVDKGTGLGLSVAKGIAQSQGGDLYLDKTSTNTTFVLKLPKASSATLQPHV